MVTFYHPHNQIYDTELRITNKTITNYEILYGILLVNILGEMT